MSFEEATQEMLDLHTQILDPDQPDPSPEQMFQVIERLHQTRGAVAKVKKESKPVIDLQSLFNKPE